MRRTLRVAALGAIALGARVERVDAALAVLQVAQSIAVDAAAQDQLGTSSALAGDLLVVGAPLDDDNGSESGAVYVFERNTGGTESWGQLRKITPLDGEAGDQFGFAVAISGDAVIVGAPFDDDACPSDPACDSGAAYVFRRNQGGVDAWDQVVKITATDAEAGDELGAAVAIDVDTVLLGAPFEDAGGADAGAAYLFERNEGGAEAWGQVRKLVAPDAAAGDELGFAVAIDAGRAAVGAPLGDAATGDSGSVYLFERNAGGIDNWGSTLEIGAADGGAGDELGHAVALDRDLLVVGAPKEDAAGVDAGAAYVFSRNQGAIDNWGQVRKLIASDAAAGAEAGSSVALAGDTIVVGAPLADSAADAGAVYLFGRHEGGLGQWGQQTRVGASAAAAGDHLGVAVALSSRFLTAGAPLDDDAAADAGAAYVFARTGDVIEQVAKVAAQDAESGIEYGAAVALSGELAAVGSPNAGPLDSGGQGPGAVYLYRRTEDLFGETWAQELKVTHPSPDFGDGFGQAVALDGEVLLAGAPLDDEACPSLPLTCNSGGVFVFERNRGGLDAWGLVAGRTALDQEAQDWYGYSVALDGDTAIVGAPFDDDACPADVDCNSGAAYILQRNQDGLDAWGEVTKITPSGLAAGGEFGWAVAISGDRVVVGAPREDVGCSPTFPNCNSGSVYVFERNQGGADQWGEVARVDPAAAWLGANLGSAVALDGDRVVAGAPSGDADPASFLFTTGVVYLFERNAGGAGQWGEVARLAAADPQLNDGFGAAVALARDRVVVGAPWDDDACVPPDLGCNSGSAFVFERNADGGDRWGPTAKLVADDASAGDSFGTAVASAGTVAFVGVPKDDDACPTDPACDSGAAYAFRWRAPETDLSITKTDGMGEVKLDQALLYTLVVTNNGADDITGAQVSDVLDPAQFTPSSGAWTCAPGPGAGVATSCPTTGSPAELAAGVDVSVGAGEGLIFQVEARVLSAAVGPIVNVARVATLSAIDVDPGNDSATDSDHLLVLGGCGEFADRVIADTVISGNVSIVACQTITVGPNVEVLSSSTLELTAGRSISIQNGFSVTAPRSMVLRIDPSLDVS